MNLKLSIVLVIATISWADRCVGQTNHLGQDFFQLIEQSFSHDPRPTIALHRVHYRPKNESPNRFSQESISINYEFEPIANSIDEWHQNQATFDENLNDFVSDFSSDHRKFYSQNNFRIMLGAFAIGAASANTPFDRSLREVIHDNLVHTRSNDYVDLLASSVPLNDLRVQRVLHEIGHIGDGYLVLPTYLSLAIIGKYALNDPNAYVIGEWGERNLRAMIVGAPVLLLSQSLTGASRPGESGYDSDWRPFRDDNGVSGHAYMGAIPFLNASRMSRNRWAKAGFFAASMLPGLSRITDDRHYPSQVFLGWTLAYLSTSAISETESGQGAVQFSPMLVGSDLGFGVTWKH